MKKFFIGCFILSVIGTIVGLSVVIANYGMFNLLFWLSAILCVMNCAVFFALIRLCGRAECAEKETKLLAEEVAKLRYEIRRLTGAENLGTCGNNLETDNRFMRQSELFLSQGKNAYDESAAPESIPQSVQSADTDLNTGLQNVLKAVRSVAEEFEGVTRLAAKRTRVSDDTDGYMYEVTVAGNLDEEARELFLANMEDVCTDEFIIVEFAEADSVAIGGGEDSAVMTMEKIPLTAVSENDGVLPRIRLVADAFACISNVSAALSKTELGDELYEITVTGNLDEEERELFLERVCELGLEEQTAVTFRSV